MKTHTPSRVPQHAARQKPPNYQRARDLPRLFPLWPDELAEESLAGRAALVQRLHTALRRERQRGLCGDWAYDLARHRQLLIAYRAEHAAWRRSVLIAVSHQATMSISRGASLSPFSLPTATAPQHSLVPPLDTQAAASISPGIVPAKDCSAIADGV
jgi:hypothetical protein